MSEITESQKPGQPTTAAEPTDAAPTAQQVSPLVLGLRGILEGIKLPDTLDLVGDRHELPRGARKGHAYDLLGTAETTVGEFLERIQRVIGQIGTLCDAHEGDQTMAGDLEQARAEKARLEGVVTGFRMELEEVQQTLAAARRRHRQDLDAKAFQASTAATDEEMCRRVMADFDRLTGWGLITSLRTQGPDGHLTFEYNYTSLSGKGTGVYTVDCRAYRLRTQLVEGGKEHSFAIDAEGITPSAWKELWTHLAFALRGTKHTLLGLPTERVSADIKAATTPSMKPAAKGGVRTSYEEILLWTIVGDHHAPDMNHGSTAWGSFGVDSRFMPNEP